MNRTLEISRRGLEMPESPIRKLAPLAFKAEERGLKIYRLNIGQPDLPTPQKALDVLKNVDRTTLEYSPSQGYLSLRKALVNYYERYQIKLSPDEIIITAGGSEAVLFAFMSCLDPGDEIIVSEPAYANYMSFAISAINIMEIIGNWNKWNDTSKGLVIGILSLTAVKHASKLFGKKSYEKCNTHSTK